MPGSRPRAPRTSRAGRVAAAPASTSVGTMMTPAYGACRPSRRPSRRHRSRPRAPRARHPARPPPCRSVLTAASAAAAVLHRVTTSSSASRCCRPRRSRARRRHDLGARPRSAFAAANGPVPSGRPPSNAEPIAAGVNRHRAAHRLVLDASPHAATAARVLRPRRPRRRPAMISLKSRRAKPSQSAGSAATRPRARRWRPGHRAGGVGVERSPMSAACVRPGWRHR